MSARLPRVVATARRQLQQHAQRTRRTQFLGHQRLEGLQLVAPGAVDFVDDLQCHHEEGNRQLVVLSDLIARRLLQRLRLRPQSAHEPHRRQPVGLPELPLERVLVLVRPLTHAYAVGEQLAVGDQLATHGEVAEEARDDDRRRLRRLQQEELSRREDALLALLREREGRDGLGGGDSSPASSR